MITDADRKLIEIKDNLSKMIEELSDIVVTERTHGFDDFSNEYKVKLELALGNLVETRKLIRNE